MSSPRGITLAIFCNNLEKSNGLRGFTGLVSIAMKQHVLVIRALLDRH